MNEATHLISMLENYRQKFDKLLDHVSMSDSKRRTKRSVIHTIFNWIFGSRDNGNSETIKQIKNNIDILQENEQNLGDKLMRQLEFIDRVGVPKPIWSPNRYVLHSGHIK